MSVDAVLLYDGRCGLCSRTVRFVLRHERAHSLRFAALDGRFAQAVIGRHRALVGIDSVVWVEHAGASAEHVVVRSDAALRVTRYLGGPWRLALAGHMLPRAWRDAAYDFVARHRHRLIPGAERCPIPAPESESRFLD